MRSGSRSRSGTSAGNLLPGAAALCLLGAPAAPARAQQQQQQQTPPVRQRTGESPKPADIYVSSNITVSPSRLRVGDVARVTLTLRNDGPSVAGSQGPPPSTVYAQGETFGGKGFTDVRPGEYSVAMTLTGPRGREWPFRWGLGGDLKLGETRRVSFPIRFTRPGLYTVYVGIAAGDTVQEAPSGQVMGVEVRRSGAAFRTRPGAMPATPPTRITVNGREVPADQRPIFHEARFAGSNVQLMVPIRFVTEALGAQVDWDSRARTARIRRGDYDLRLRVGSTAHTLNGRPVTSYSRPRVVSGRTMVPIRFISEQMGGTVDWDVRTRTVAVNLPGLDSSQASRIPMPGKNPNAPKP
ncbi:MAG TPA: copper amine oxidase N-terminal domain-containing protein [Armatimonadaceae bacterium]|nr:copper amine oxidase N-terminal domain-containing protein [Armatimonadaceae bacterium]